MKNETFFVANSSAMVFAASCHSLSCLSDSDAVFSRYFKERKKERIMSKYIERQRGRERNTVRDKAKAMRDNEMSVTERRNKKLVLK